MRRFVRPGRGMLLAVFLLATPPPALAGDDEDPWERTTSRWLETIPADGTIRVVNPFGNVYARFGGYENRVELLATAQRLEDDLPELRVSRAHVESRLEILVAPEDGAEERRRDRVDLVIFVPRGATLDVRTRDGDIEAIGLLSDLIATSVTGDIYVRKVRGHLRLDTERGKITAARLTGASDLPRQLSTGPSPAVAESPRERRGSEVSAPTTPFVLDVDVRDLPRPREWRPGDPIRDIPLRRYRKPGAPEVRSLATGVDPLMQAQLNAALYEATSAFITPTRNFPGQVSGPNGSGVPDTVGDVGPAHYVQAVNSQGHTQINIYDKAEPVPALLATFNTSSLGQCGSDGIVVYDRQADRWLLTAFGGDLCVAVSQTGDPVAGGWFVYNFTTPFFPDYPKLGVWPTDANGGAGSYITTVNDDGVSIFAFDRAAMLAGNPTTFQRFVIPPLSAFHVNSPTPADIDGPTSPPPGTPAIVMRHRDTEIHGGPAAPGDVLEMWAFDVDWTNPANTTLTAEPDIDVADFDSDLCGLDLPPCFQQPGSSAALIPLHEVIMLRVQYMVHEYHESLVGSFVVDVDATDHGGVRWFELRRAGSGWTLYQEGTYSIDADDRWMSPSAMDQSGNIAIGYSVVSATTFASLRYAGRLADDPLGILTTGEASIHEGNFSKDEARNGDYASMSLDPSDDCTFWFTGQTYLSSIIWGTQIASFRFDACGCELAPLPPASSAFANGDNRIDVTWNDSELDTVIEYRVKRSRTPGGPYETLLVIPDSSPGFAGGPSYGYADTDVSGTIAYYYVVEAFAGGVCRSSLTNEVSVTATGPCTLGPLFTGAQDVEAPYFATCALDVSWGSATAECAGPVSYNVYRSDTPDFIPDDDTRLAAGLAGNSFTDIDSLVSGEDYFYMARAVDGSNGIEDANQVEVQGVPLGELTTGTWLDDAGDTGPAKMIAGSPWYVDPATGNFGPRAYFTGDYGNMMCAALTTPPLRLGANSQLAFYTAYDIQRVWDKGVVQISSDGGATWDRLEVGYTLISNQTSDHCQLPTGTYFTGTDMNWTQYGADLSPWAGADVQLRFLISSDDTVTASGWWIDDISVTEVGLPGNCATGGICEDNPSVDVQPDGPLTACVVDAAPLTAAVAGGTAPFSYLWTEDGQPIPGATGATLSPAPGTHVYNCEINADTCAVKVRDNFRTEVTTVDTPSFGGIVSAVDVQGQTCAVSLSWDPADTICPGPLKYFVYRDTLSPVSPTPDRIVASNLDGTSLVDTAGTVNNETYHYLVRVLDLSTGRFDGNSVEASATPIGAGGGVQIAFQEDFDLDGALDSWTVDNTPPEETCGAFARTTLLGQKPAGGTLGYARAYPPPCVDPALATVLTSPSIDLTSSGVQTVTLEYDIYYKYGSGGDEVAVEVWDGSAWQEIWHDADADLNANQSFDVTAFASDVPDFQMRFVYQGGDQWFSVDNVVVTVVIPCETVIGPPPAPDGRNGTTPMTVAWDGAPGGDIAVAWDASSCTAGDYHLLYGDLAGVGSYPLSGSECSIGTGGTFTWTGVPPGSLFFLVVGADGAGIEGSWGVDSFFGERNGPAPSGQCGSVAKDTSGICS